MKSKCEGSAKCGKPIRCTICRACREHCTEHPQLLQYRTPQESAFAVERALEHSRQLARRRGETPTF